jgi:hypothetical protein
LEGDIEAKPLRLEWFTGVAVLAGAKKEAEVVITAGGRGETADGMAAIGTTFAGMPEALENAGLGWTTAPMGW